ncbi:hypothetical protein G7B40_025195 [Aetokthonos hydrillicola Thurmond2011]|jgi:hypothetical protein|uniref:Uncharacterized protein n=1 Tax=Aetokthonos hydrillicola Thurmond2011 TaxID=2712845 RepID=A0AAP5ICP9_9CYAN|nr:hypothetical protein [Aetokthonos hydrillicola]MBO3458446.1 hypothetical protein [Aetokthonos hydrillicola CCALA 1050]MBW4586227.1 hypothetical protein [Aetokthonos hydrillicola CCALA 1050]MDR9897834.1 hypothetical protein [Aetokthonos hydrillicola Thurmond2011]
MQLQLLSAESLRRYQIPLTVKEGIWYLEELSEQISLLALYQELFPIQWASSTTPIIQHSYSGVYSDREIEFLELVNEHLFSLDWIEDFRDCSERHLEIPVYPQNIDWWDMDLADLSLTKQFLVSLLGYGHPQEEWDLHFAFIPEKLIPADKIDWDKLDKLCQKAALPLRFLYDILCLVDHSTGCIWLDINHEIYESLPWNKESLLYLKEQWTISQQYWQRMNEFSEWLESSIAHRKQVIKLWNKAQQQIFYHH